MIAKGLVVFKKLSLENEKKMLNKFWTGSIHSLIYGRVFWSTAIHSQARMLMLELKIFAGSFWAYIKVYKKIKMYYVWERAIKSNDLLIAE